MTLRPVRFVAVSVLTCAFVLTGCTSGSGSAPGKVGASTSGTAVGSGTASATSSGTSSDATGDESALEQELGTGREQMAALDGTVTGAPARTVAGAAARGFTTTFKQQGIDLLARSYGVQRNGKIYLLTLTASKNDADHARGELDDLASTWAWK